MLYHSMGLSLTAVFVFTLCFSAYAEDVVQRASLLPPQYQPYADNLPLRRREGGLVSDSAYGSVNRGLSRGANRGLARGVSRGANRGLSRGANRGLSRGANRGLARGTNRGVSRGANRGLARGLARGVNRAGIPSEIDLAVTPPPDIIAPIATRHTGLTQSDQPELYWFISKDWPGEVFFNLNEPGEKDPLLEVALHPGDSGMFKAGYHVVRLGDYEIKLKPGVEYEWFVYMILDPVERSADFLASATIKYVQPTSQQLQAVIANPDMPYAVYSRQGYWYDAIADLSERIQHASADLPALQDYRRSLLNQVDMPKVAVFNPEERK